MMHVLHITAWYPTAEAPLETPFAQRHIAALEGCTSNQVWHIDARPSDRWQLERDNPPADRAFILRCATQRWRLIEWAAGILILWAWLTRDRSRKVDVVNFHVAYPNCAWLGLLRRVMRRPMVITEHFSAYHFKFNGTGRGMSRIKRIFHQSVPVITVSDALAEDIRSFAGAPFPSFHRIDNVVDTQVFAPPPEPMRERGRFFALAQWRYPKRPEALIEAFASLRAKRMDAHLRLGGDGPLLERIRVQIASLGLDHHVTLLGPLAPAQVADEMRRAHAFLHASDYETYSAVCAEALCCGTYVVASKVGGIPEFLDARSGAWADSNDGSAWASAIERAWDIAFSADTRSIAERMAARCSPTAVGKRYAAVLASIAEAWRG
jgi:glycosyltransferase involved in cell wall biosynthesis